MRQIVRSLLLLIALCIAPSAGNSAFSMLQVSGNANRGDVICDTGTGLFSGVGGPGTCIASPPVCNGSVDDQPGFAAFNTWALSWQASHPGLLIELHEPEGKACNLASASFFQDGIRRLLVTGYGASLTGHYFSTGDKFKTGVCFRGIAQSDGCSARTLSASIGQTSVTLANPALASRFTAGRWALMSGFDLQTAAPGTGYPPNLHYIDYVKITSVVGAQVFFDRRLSHDYLSTWPLYDAGGAFSADLGGPATLYQLGVNFDIEVEYRGLAMDAAGGQQVDGPGKSVTFRDTVWAGLGTAIPSQNVIWQFINSSMATSIEADKLVGTVWLVGSTLHSIGFQSSSIDELRIVNSSITGALNGTPKRTYIYNSTLFSVVVGVTSFGRSDSFYCELCVVTGPVVPGPVHKGGFSEGGFTNPDYVTMSGNVLSLADTNERPDWAVPGTNLCWTGQFRCQNMVQITGVTQVPPGVGGVTKVAFSTNPAYPPTPPFPLTSSKLYATVHPSPIFTCKQCSGNPDMLDWSNAPPGIPMYSYSSRSYNQSTLRGSSTTIVSGAYDPAGIVTLTLTADIGIVAPAAVTVSSATGTGSFAQINGTYVTLPGTTGATLKYRITSGSTMTITGANVAPNLAFSIWGTPSSYDVNVTTAYIPGSPNPLTLHAAGAFDNAPTINPTTFGLQSYGPNINLKQAGERIATPAGATCNTGGGPVAGPCSGDGTGSTGIVFPDPGSFLADQHSPSVSNDVHSSGTFGATITIQTNQGVVIPAN